MKQAILYILAGLIITGGIMYYQWFVRDAYELPESHSEVQVITLENDSMEEILETDGVRHSIPLDEILSGGPPKDGIPSIDDPFFMPVVQAPTWLDGTGEGISLILDGVERFYPFQVLVQHEIANDEIDGQKVLVTYCPLCKTGVVFDPIVKGERVEFGVSGKLWNSNLLMYDRSGENNESLWSQISGEGVVGPATGETLPIILSDIVTLDAFTAAHPNGEVIVGKNGREGRYTSIPYGGDLNDIDPIFPVNHKDDRLDENAFILGVEVDGNVKAYHVDAIEALGEAHDTVGDTMIIARFEEEEGAVRIYTISEDDSETRLQAIPSFWFSWVAVHPETELYK